MHMTLAVLPALALKFVCSVLVASRTIFVPMADHTSIISSRGDETLIIVSQWLLNCLDYSSYMR
jgi:hypothetical protein